MTRQYGELSAGRRRMPDFLVIGTKRGGTTSLWNYLVSHPDVLPMFPAAQQIKSPHYFDIHHDRGQRWYRSHFPTDAARERASRRRGRRVVTGEASPYYLFHPLAPERVAAEMPDARLVVSLRNPVDRAYSNYNERRGSGMEPLLTFEEALAAEPVRLRGQDDLVASGRYSPSHDSHTYLARGRYAEQLSRWFEHVPRSSVHVVLNEDLAADPGAVVGSVCDFLEISRPSSDDYPHHNLLPARSLDPGTRARLVEYYRPHNEVLARMLGVDLGWDR